jgi:predicted TPR repeat methyltransferase
MPDGVPLIDPDVLAGRIAKLLNEKRTGAVKPLLAALAKLAPRHKDLTQLRVSYCSQIEDYAQARQVLEDEMAREPGNAVLHLQHGEILFCEHDYAGAAAKAAEAVVANPSMVRAKSLLGISLMKLGQFDAALPCLMESFATDPSGVDVALGLAALAPGSAIEILETAIAATPRLAVLRNSLTRRYLAAGDIANGMQIAVQARADGLADAETHCLLAFAQIQEGQWEDARASVAQAQSISPASAWAARLAAALAEPIGELSPLPETNAVAAEQALLAAGTILPGTFRTLLQEMQTGGPVLDLFCGTGLNAIAANDVCAGQWTGVDPDPVLLRLCEERGLYERLENDRPLAFMAHGGAYSVIILNEALAYTASLQPWFAGVRACLAPGGVALAAIPSGRTRLTGHGLFAHGLEQIAEQAAQAGLSANLSHSGTLRRIEGIPLPGVIARFHVF